MGKRSIVLGEFCEVYPHRRGGASAVPESRPVRRRVAGRTRGQCVGE